MKIVIDIPEEDYNAYKMQVEMMKQEGILIESLSTALRILVANGTPLPEHHGRIIDYGYVVDAIDDWINAEEYCYTNATDYLRNRIRNVPTIIEAEGSDSE